MAQHGFFVDGRLALCAMSSLVRQRSSADWNHRRSPGVHGPDDLGVVDACR
jgi:hypothetical protein